MSEFQFVNPGFKSREFDLTEAIETIGSTFVGLVGETLWGPAFEKVKVSGQKGFKAFFGDKSNERLGGNPRFPLPFYALNYLEEANQLYVTRVLGLTGYNAGPAYVLKHSGGQVLAVLRSRARYTAQGDATPTFLATNITATITPGSAMLADFTINVTLQDATTQSYLVSLDANKSNYITRVLGKEIHGRKGAVYVDQIFPSFINKISAFNPAASLASITKLSNNIVQNYQTGFKTPESPFVVSELRGTEIEKLFKFISISDGASANTLYKISVLNIDPETREFEIHVRDFNDRDDDPVILERFQRCSMNPNLPGYVAKKVGAIDGTYDQRSSYVTLDVNYSASENSIPCGFEGYVVRNFGLLSAGSVNPSINIKSVYNAASERITRVYLGLTDTIGIDSDIFKYFGAFAEGNTDYTAKTKGFHMDSGATGNYVGIGEFQVGAGMFRVAADAYSGTYADRATRKFTLCMAGGFDGWDEHRDMRTNQGIFKKGMSYNPGNVDTDFYAWTKAMATFSNPEEVYINVFATPGLNFEDHQELIQDGIEIVERERGDAVFIIDAPDYDTPEQLADALEFTNLDTSYGATFGPHVQARDAASSSNIFLPATHEVLRNIAYNDNVKFPWFAVAGVNRGVTKSNKARFKPSEPQRGAMLKAGINPLATFADVGVVIWGNRTLQRKDTYLQDLNIRRLLLEVRKKISTISITLLFEQNDEKVRDEFLSKVQPILQNIQRERGLSSYSIKLDSSSSPDIQDRKQMLGTIQLKPIGALENIGMDFILTPAGASFK